MKFDILTFIFVIRISYFGFDLVPMAFLDAVVDLDYVLDEVVEVLVDYFALLKRRFDRLYFLL